MAFVNIDTASVNQIMCSFPEAAGFLIVKNTIFDKRLRS